MKTVSASAVIPTRNRSQVLERTLTSLLEQGVLPAEMIVVDGSENEETRRVVEAFESKAGEHCRVIWLSAKVLGAAAQRNQGVEVATQPVIAFCDDDILFEQNCLQRLWSALHSAKDIGGVNAMITNQKFHPPGLASRLVYRLLGGGDPPYAGRVLGPAVNLLPEDRDDLPEVVAVEWMNLGCTLYRREALPVPAFSSHFTGYSMMEDMTLSVTVARRWRLLNARTARIFHDSQPGSHKADPMAMARMETVNRNYVMTQVLGRNSPMDYGRMIAWQAFSLLASLRSRTGRRELLPNLLGRLQGWRDILR